MIIKKHVNPLTGLKSYRNKTAEKQCLEVIKFKFLPYAGIARLKGSTCTARSFPIGETTRLS